MADVVDLDAELAQVEDFWAPRTVGRVNDTLLKVVRVQGSFPEHRHEHEDECFLVLDGTLTIDLDDGPRRIGAGQFLVVPKGALHRPHCDGPVRLLLIEPADTVQHGSAGAEAVAAARATAPGRSGPQETVK